MLPSPDRESGLLPEGAHRATWDEIRAVLVDGAPAGQRTHRSAVLSSLKGWSCAAVEHLGPGTLLIAGGFVTFSEPTWTAVAAFVPDDESRLAQEMEPHGSYWQLVSLVDVFFTGPEPGGTLDRRTSVGGLVDALVIGDADRQLAHRILCISDTPRPLGHVRKGYVEVVTQT